MKLCDKSLIDRQTKFDKYLIFTRNFQTFLCNHNKHTEPSVGIKYKVLQDNS